MKDALYLAVRYLRFSKARTAVLVLGTTVALFLPIFTWTAAQRLESDLLARARSSPILLGHAGNELDLTLATLYFRGRIERPVPFGLGRRSAARAAGPVIPISVGHSVAGNRLVGTSPAYFSARQLQASQGRLPVQIGEIVAGAQVASSFRLAIGDQLRSDLSNLYNIAGAYPLLLEVVGILEARGTSDDEVFFTDIKTTWALDGLFHGHGEVTPEASLNPEAKENENLEATAALFLFSEITDATRPTFHLHGSMDEAPVSAFLVLPQGFPRDRRAHDQLLGDFALDPLYQAVRPQEVISNLWGIILRLRDALEVYFALVAFSTLAFFVLVMSLSLRLRRDELRLMARMGCDRFRLATLMGAEAVLVLGLSSAVCGLFVWLAMKILFLGLL